MCLGLMDGLPGALSGVEAPVYAGPDPRKRRITVGHLLTHSSGLACNEMDDASPGNEERMQRQQAEPDWYQYFLDLPFTSEPGSTYAYCAAGINLAVRHRPLSLEPDGVR